MEPQNAISKFKTGQLVRVPAFKGKLGYVGGITSKDSRDRRWGLNPPVEVPGLEWYTMQLIDDEKSMIDPVYRSMLLNSSQETMAESLVHVNNSNMALACQCCLKADPAASLQFCSKCRAAPYCGKDCQRQDWKRHKYFECLRLGLHRDRSKISLFKAAVDGSIDMVRRLLQEGADVNKSSACGGSALGFAPAYGYRSIVECLVEHKADVNRVDLMGAAPLHMACLGGQKDIVEFLVQHKADVNLIDAKSTVSPLAAALQQGHFAIAQWLLQYKEQTIDLDRRYKNSYTILLSTIAGNDLSSAKFLVEHGANIHIRSKGGVGELYCAAAKGYIDIVIVGKLVEQGIIVDCDAVGKWQPLHAAVDGNHVDVVRYLSQHGLVNSSLLDGRTAQMVAIRQDNLPMVRCMTEEGATISKIDNHGYSSFHYAALHSSLPIVQYLVEQKADLERCNSISGDSPLVIALNNPNREVAPYIRSQLRL